MTIGRKMQRPGEKLAFSTGPINNNTFNYIFS